MIMTIDLMNVVEQIGFLDDEDCTEILKNL